MKNKNDKNTKSELAKNRKAYHEYEIGESLEAGIVLVGTEVKSVRAGKVNLTDGWVGISDDLEAFLYQVKINPYSHGNIYNHRDDRPRKLLLKRAQIIKLQRQTQAQGYSIVPLRIYLKEGFVKVQIAVARGKKQHDKREDARKKDADLDIARAMRNKG